MWYIFMRFDKYIQSYIDYHSIIKNSYTTPKIPLHWLILNWVLHFIIITLWTYILNSSPLPGPSPGDLPSPGMEPKSPGLLHWRQILYCLCHQESPKNTGVGSHFLLQRIFQLRVWACVSRSPSLQGNFLPSEPPGKH